MNQAKEFPPVYYTNLCFYVNMADSAGLLCEYNVTTDKGNVCVQL